MLSTTVQSLVEELKTLQVQGLTKIEKKSFFWKEDRDWGMRASRGTFWASSSTLNNLWEPTQSSLFSVLGEEMCLHLFKPSPVPSELFRNVLKLFCWYWLLSLLVSPSVTLLHSLEKTVPDFTSCYSHGLSSTSLQVQVSWKSGR